MKSVADEIALSMQAFLADSAKREMYGTLPVKQASAEAEVSAKADLADDVEIKTEMQAFAEDESKMDDNKLIKSAYNKLMEASTELEEAGFDVLSANALVLVNHLIVEAKAKKNKMTDKEKEAFEKMKEKEKLKKLKDKEKVEKDKNDARDKSKKDKEKEKLLKEREAQRDKLNKMQEKANKTKKE